LNKRLICLQSTCGCDRFKLNAVKTFVKFISQKFQNIYLSRTLWFIFQLARAQCRVARRRIGLAAQKFRFLGHKSTDFVDQSIIGFFIKSTKSWWNRIFYTYFNIYSIIRRVKFGFCNLNSFWDIHFFVKNKKWRLAAKQRSCRHILHNIFFMSTIISQGLLPPSLYILYIRTGYGYNSNRLG
jgi:hypothetical protein